MLESSNESVGTCSSPENAEQCDGLLLPIRSRIASDFIGELALDQILVTAQIFSHAHGAHIRVQDTYLNSAHQSSRHLPELATLSASPDQNTISLQAEIDYSK